MENKTKLSSNLEVNVKNKLSSGIRKGKGNVISASKHSVATNSIREIREMCGYKD